jgi:superfamily II DNA or RNA helicase
MLKLVIGNSRTRVLNATTQMWELLRYELSWKAGEPGNRVHQQPDGSTRVRYWDGFKPLLRTGGWMPTGLVPRAGRLLAKWQVPHIFEDQRIRPQDQIPRWAKPAEPLWAHQERAVMAAYRAGRGVIDSPPRSGKTRIMAELLRMVSAPTVITAPTEPIARQTYEKLLALYRDAEWTCQVGDCAGDFFLLTGGVPKKLEDVRALGKATVFVATAATAALMSAEWWSKIECLMVDERHHQAADTYHEINDLAVNAYWRWGFTGSNYRSDPGEQIALEACLGRTVASYSIAEMVTAGVLVGGEVEFWPIELARMKTIPFAQAYKRGVVESEVRNAAVVQAVNELLADKRRVLVLVHDIAHGNQLVNLIPGSAFVQGKDGDEVGKAVAALHSGKLQCLIGSPVVGEGLDCPAADALVYAKAKRAKVTHTQDTFRVLTAQPGKRPARIVDFADRFNHHTMEHSIERLRNYRAMGLKVSVRPSIPVDGKLPDRVLLKNT